MSATPGRVLCPRCGANNFETQAACWKCSSSLAPGAPGAPVPRTSTTSTAPNGTHSAAPVPPALATPYRPAASVDSSVAVISAVVLGLLFTYVAVPAGLVFMMLDDRRKVDIGRITLIVGILASVAHFFITIALAQHLFTSSLGTMVQQVQKMKNPGLGDEVSDRDLNGIPGVPGLGNGPRQIPTYQPPQAIPSQDVPFPAPLPR